MSDTFDTRVPPPRRTIGTPIGWAIVALLALFTIATALIAVGVDPTLDGQIVAALVGLIIVVIAVVVTVALPVIHKLRRTTSNDDWIYW